MQTDSATDSTPPPALHASDVDHPHDVVRLKKILHAEDIARAFDNPRLRERKHRWDVRRARRWLRRCGVGFPLTPGGEWVTTLEALGEQYPYLRDVYLRQCPEEDIVGDWGG